MSEAPTSAARPVWPEAADVSRSGVDQQPVPVAPPQNAMDDDIMSQYLPQQDAGTVSHGQKYSQSGTQPGPVLPVFWTGSFLKSSFLDGQIIL